MGCHRLDDNGITFPRYADQIANAAKIDRIGGLGQPHLQGRDQGHAAGDDNTVIGGV